MSNQEIWQHLVISASVFVVVISECTQKTKTGGKGREEKEERERKPEGKERKKKYFKAI